MIHTIKSISVYPNVQRLLNPILIRNNARVHPLMRLQQGLVSPQLQTYISRVTPSTSHYRQTATALCDGSTVRSQPLPNVGCSGARAAVDCACLVVPVCQQDAVVGHGVVVSKYTNSCVNNRDTITTLYITGSSIKSRTWHFKKLVVTWIPFIRGRGEGGGW